MENVKLVLMAVAVPTSKLIADLKEAINEYELIENEHNKQRCMFHMHLLMINLITSGDMSEGFKMMKQMDDLQKLNNVFTTTEN
jgi:hypothetical protein